MFRYPHSSIAQHSLLFLNPLSSFKRFIILFLFSHHNIHLTLSISAKKMKFTLVRISQTLTRICLIFSSNSFCFFKFSAASSSTALCVRLKCSWNC